MKFTVKILLLVVHQCRHFPCIVVLCASYGVTPVQNNLMTATVLNDLKMHVEFYTDLVDQDVEALERKIRWDTTDNDEFFCIESVDKASDTIMVGYRMGMYSSAIDGPYKQHGKPVKCTYTCDEECITIYTADPIKIEIYPDMYSTMLGYRPYPVNY